nr:FAD-dependent oxidoreductase [uncultured Halomonas sp.]
MAIPLSPLTAHHSVAIIGAGLSGLACGEVLASSGATISLFDKARGPGGRMSSKRRPNATLDLGAQAFSVRNADFQHTVDRWLAAGCVAPWPTRTYQASSSGWQAHNDGQIRYTGAPRMSAVTRYLAETLDALPNTTLTCATPIASLKRIPTGWQLVDANDTTHGPFDYVVISAPPPQAQALLAPWDAELAAACQARKQRACWAGWAIFEQPLPPFPGVDQDWQMARVTHPALRLVSRNHTKPGRENQPESISLLAQLDWSEAQLEQSPEHVAEQLLTALKSILPASVQLPALIESGAHRWRYAQSAASCETAYLYSQEGLALCGDGFGDGFADSRVEGAWLSGHRLGEKLVGRSVY